MQFSCHCCSPTCGSFSVLSQSSGAEWVRLALDLLCLPALRSCVKGVTLIVALGVFVEPPSFVKAAQPTEGLKGKDVSLYSEMSGTAPFQITWFKDKKPLMESRKYKILSEGSSATLHIMGIEASDAGQYECKVSNSVGSDTCQASVKLRGQ